MNGDLEATRQRYRPVGPLHLLFLGESPPPGRGFFYTGDSTLFRVTKPVFVRVCDFPSDPDAWLAAFAEAGCYLDDFSPTRGDKPHARPNAADVRDAIRRLTRLVSEGQPTVVVPVLREIADLAGQVVAASARPETPLRVLRFRTSGASARRRSSQVASLQYFASSDAALARSLTRQTSSRLATRRLP